MSSFGNGAWFLGSAVSSNYSATTLTVGAGNTYRLGGGGATLTLSAANVLTGANNVLVGSSSTNGAGTVTLSSASGQNYTGTTTVTGGATLSIGGDNRLGTGTGVGNIVLNGGALSASASFTLAIGRGIAVGPASGSGSGTLDVAGSQTLTYSGIIANNGGGTGGLTKTGSGTLTLTGANTYSGTTGISGGVLNFANLGNLGIGNAIAFNGGTLQYAVGNTADITARTVTTTYVSNSATGATIDTNGNDVTFVASAITGTGSFTKSGAGTLTLNVANTYTGATAITAGTVKLGQVNALPLTTLTLNGGATAAGTLDVNGLDVTVSNLTGTAGSVNGRIINSASGSANTLTVNSTGGSTFAGIIADNNGTGGTLALAKTGSSILTLAGANTYSDGTSVTGGALSISSDANLGTAPAAAAANIFLNGGTLSASTSFELNANRSIALGPAGGSGNGTLEASAGTTLTYNGTLTNNGAGTGGLIKTNTTGTLVLGGANTYAGDTTLLGGTLKITNTAAIPSGSGKGNVSISSNSGGVLDLNGKAITINGLSGAGGITSGVTGTAAISIGGNDQGGSFSGVISNGSDSKIVSIAKIGGGTLTLSGTNTYTGGTTITGGILSIGADSNLGAAPGLATPGNLVINSGTLATSATLTLSSNRGIAVGPDSGSGIGTLAVGTGTTLTYGGIIANNGGGSGGLTKTNTSGSLVLAGANTYSGDTTISGGTLQLGNAAAIPSGSGRGNLTLASGSMLDLNNLSPTVNGLAGTGTVTNALAGAVTFTVGANDAGGGFGGVIADGNGSVALTKTGMGVLTLGGLNTYSGATSVASGTLQLGIAAAIPSGTGKGNLVLNGTLDLAGISTTINGLSGSGSVTNSSATAATLTAGSNDITSAFTGNIQNGTGSVALTKTGAGTLTLSGTNTFSGATTINTGTLAMGSSTGLSASSSVTINSSGTLDVSGNNITIDGLLGTGTINNNGGSAATLTAGASGTSTTFGGVIADGGKAIALTKTGAGTLTLTGVNTYSGTTTIQNGTVSVANPGPGGNLGTATSAVILGDASHQGILSYTANADLTYTRGFEVNAGGGQMNITSSGKTLTLSTGAVITTTTGAFTLGGAGNVVVTSVISGSGGFTKANTGTLLLGSVNTYAGDTTISSGTLQLGNVAALPSGSGKGNLALSGTLDVNNLSITLNGLSGAGTITNTGGSAVTLTAGDNNAAGNFTGLLQDGSGTTSLTKIGTGVLRLGGVNTYSGDTTITGGTLQIDNAYAIASGPNKGNVSLGAGGTLDLNDFDMTLNGLSGGGLVTNNLGASVLAVGATDRSATFSGNIRDGLVTGTIGLTKTGTGTLTLSGNNTFSGATTLAGGTLSMGSDTALSSHSTLTIENAGALDLNGRVIAIDGLAGTGSITNNSATAVTLTTGASGGSGIFGGTINDGTTGVIALTKTGVGTVTLSNINSYSGGTTVTGGLLAITSTGALGAIPVTPTPGNIVLNGGGISATNTFEISANRGISVGPASGSGGGILDAAQNQTLTYNGIIANHGLSGSGGLTKTGLGTLTLGGVNTYSGDTSVSAGALQIGNANAIPSGSSKGNLALAGDTTLDLNNTSITVNGLSGTGVVSNTKTGTVTLSAGANNQTSTFDGLIEDGNGKTTLTKVGTGILTLSGTNEYTGKTIITEGKLSVATSAALGLESNDLTISGGATLKVTGSFNTSRSTELTGAGGGVGGTFEVASGATLEYTSSSVISGSGSLIKTGDGTLSIGGADTYIGGTYIKAGTLVVTSGLALGPLPTLGSGNYAVHMDDGTTIRLATSSWASDRQLELVSGTATIDVSNGVTIVRNGAISGSGAMNSIGAGTLIINNSGTNANTYSGGTIIENGVLQVNNTTGSATGTGAVTVRNGGTLSGLTAQGSATGTTGTITGTVEIASTGKLLARSGGTLTLGGLTLAEGSLSTFQLGAVTTTSVVDITGTNSLALAGASTIDIINTGLMAVGTYRLYDYTGTAFSNLTNLTLAEPHSGLFNLSLVNNTSNTSIDLGVEAIVQQWQKNGTNTNWSENHWWTVSPYTVPNGVGATALFINNNYLGGSDPVFAATETATLNTEVMLGSLVFNNATTAFTINALSGQTLTLDEVGNGNAVIQVINASGANHLIGVPVILNDNLTVALASGLDISGAISGELKTLTKTGTGTLTLSGASANTYSGLTEVVGGTLNLNKSAGLNAIGTGGLQIDYGSTVALLASNQIADGTSVTVNGTFALGTYSETISGMTGGGEVTTGSGSVLTLQSAANSSFQGVISGSGGIAKAGSGALTLDGVNTYTGGTAINGGILRVGADHNLGGTGGLAFDNGTLAFSDGFTSARSILLNLGGGTLDTDNSDVVLTGLISGAGTLTKTGIGTITLNTANDYTGATIIENGILRISNTLSLGTVAGGTTVKPGGELELYGAGLTVNEPLTLNGGEVCTLLGTNTYNGAITLTDDSGIDADSDKLIITSMIGQSGGAFGLTKFGPGIVELTGANTYTGATQVEAGTLSLSNGAAITDIGAITLADAPGVLLLLNASETIGSLAGGGTTGGNVQLATYTLTAGDASSTSFAGVISGTGGALTKQGAGTLTLSGANTHTGLTTVSAGALNIQNATALGTSAGATTVAVGAALQLQGDITVGAEALTLNGLGIDATGALRNISGTNTYGGLLTLGSATRINSDAGSLTLSNTGTITGSHALTVGGAGDTSISAIIGTGGGTLTKDGGGTLTLSGANTYAGNTTVTAGTLRVDNPLAIPSGTDTGNLSLAAPATLDLNNTRISVNGLSGTGLVTNLQTGTAALTVGANDQTSIFDGMITDGNGTTALAKTGTGILTLTGSNHFSGGTTITAGTLQVGADTHLGHAADTPTPGSLVIQAGATLATTATFTLDNNRGIAVGPSGAGTIDVADTTTLSYSGSIADNAGSGGLSKTGSGTLVLSGTSTYTGTTTVAAGALTVNGAIANSGIVVVQSGATLTGTGTTGALTVEASGTLAPGNSAIGTLSAAGNLILAGITSVELGTAGTDRTPPGPSDRVEVTGNITLGGSLILTDNAGANNQGSAGAGSYQLFTYLGEAGGSFASVSGLPAYHAAVHDVADDHAIYLDVYNYAGATVTPAVDVGRIHAGGSFGTQALTVTNTAAAGGFSEALGAAFGTLGTGLTATGAVTGIAGGSNNSSSMSVGISDTTAGPKSGTVAVNFTSQAVASSGLSNTALTSQNVTVTGFAYTGQSTWTLAASGVWGNNVEAHGNWSASGGVPGLDGSLSASDTATFGSAISAPTTVSLNGAHPSLSAMTFDNAATAYTLAQGAGDGTLTLKGNGGAATVMVAGGSHTVSVPVRLASDVSVTVTNNTDILTMENTLSGSGYGLTKSGAGTLALSGESTYTGATAVSLGTLLVNGTLANTTTSVADHAILGGTGTLGGATTINSGGTHAPGEVGAVGTQNFAGALTYAAGSIFEWDLNASGENMAGMAFDMVGAGGAITVDTGNTTFKIVFGDKVKMSDEFWSAPYVTHEWLMTSIFGKAFAGTGGFSAVQTSYNVSQYGSFTISNTSLVYTSFAAVPEPTSALVGLVLGAGLLRRQRNSRIDRVGAGT
ncbi:MAG: autotransporter-associated beta strand repeat-containing protein [Verrucomicrobia bacterium]|nr:autotransporter-associated beta strand repeat-containing protein [Verrucomicrobiota bacterium]